MLRLENKNLLYTINGQQWTSMNHFGITIYFTDCRTNFAADAVFIAV